jgi:hypothetical protein
MNTELEYKKRFAAELLKVGNTDSASIFKAALVVFGKETGQALRIANEWVYDPEVLAEQERLKEEKGVMSFLPTKSDLAKAVWDKAREEYVATEDFTKLMRLYAEIMSFIEKPGLNVTNNVISNRVMIVKDHGSDSDWEAKLAQQQKALISESTVVN